MNRPYGSYEGIALVTAILCGTPGIEAEGGFYPPDFGGAHRSEPRPHMAIFPYYF
jgi:hypothetical protein